MNCPWCTRPTQKPPRHGRRTFRHKCPHGYWCPRADKLRQHDNNYPMGGRDWCEECYTAYYDRERKTRGINSEAREQSSQGEAGKGLPGKEDAS